MLCHVSVHSVACEQALLFGRVKQVSREHASERRSPNRRACSQAMHSGAFCLRHRARDLISVAFFDRVALLSDFNPIYWVKGPGFAPNSSSAFYILELCSKNILKTLTANFKNNFHVGNVCFPYKALEWNADRMQSLSESRKGSKVTKTIFSNSRKRYWDVHNDKYNNFWLDWKQ